MSANRRSLSLAGCVLVLCAVLALSSCAGVTSTSGGQSIGGANGVTHVPANPCTLVTTDQMAAVVGIPLQASHQSVANTCDYSPPGASANIVAKVTAFAQTPDGWSVVKSVAQSSATQSPSSGLEFQPLAETSADAFFGGDTITAFKDGVQITIWIGQLPGMGSAQLGDSPALLAAETRIAGVALAQV